MVKRVLVACEFSGIVREELAKFKEIDAWSCDLLPTEIPGQHIQGDVLEIINDRWDLMIAHPPCTRLCNSGVRWLHERNLWKELDEACEFFLRLYNAPIKQIAIENPVMHKYAKERIGVNYSFSVQPWQFGDGETKRTCFWPRHLPNLKPTYIVNERKPRVHYCSPSKDRWKERSRTPKGLAKAIAQQWGLYSG